MSKIKKIKPESRISQPTKKDNEILICKVGSEERPASYEDLICIQQGLAQVRNNPDLTLVTHHCIEFVAIDKNLLENVIVVGNIDPLLQKLSG